MYLWTHQLGEPQPPQQSNRPGRPRCGNPLDTTAQSIIQAAQDPSVPIHSRAVSTVWQILRTYYPNEVGKVSSVVYVEKEPGLQTTSVGAGSTTRGILTVGRYFVEQTTAAFFARRVLQVGHELRHIDQWRAGMVGPSRKAEREFLAHCWTALQREQSGTGCMSHSTRVAIIDAALGNYYCLGQNERSRYAAHVSRLHALRPTEEAASGRPATQAPTTCQISH